MKYKDIKQVTGIKFLMVVVFIFWKMTNEELAISIYHSLKLSFFTQELDWKSVLMRLI